MKMPCQTLLMMILALGNISWAVEMPSYITNDRDLKFALKAAQTPEDHERIAAYYQVKADQLDAKAAEYEQDATAYRNGPMIKNLASPNTAARYESIAKRLRHEAQINRSFAATHERVAATAEDASQ